MARIPRSVYGWQESLSLVLSSPICSATSMRSSCRRRPMRSLRSTPRSRGRAILTIGWPSMQCSRKSARDPPVLGRPSLTRLKRSTRTSSIRRKGWDKPRGLIGQDDGPGELSQSRFPRHPDYAMGPEWVVRFKQRRPPRAAHQGGKYAFVRGFVAGSFATRGAAANCTLGLNLAPSCPCIGLRGHGDVGLPAYNELSDGGAFVASRPRRSPFQLARWRSQGPWSRAISLRSTASSASYVRDAILTETGTKATDSSVHA